MPTTIFEFPDHLDLTHYVSAEAHDLRSPFNRIIGFTKLVLKGMDGPLTDMQKEDLTTVYSNSAHALNMMNNLVDAARLGLKEKQVNCKEIETNNLIGQAVSHWQQNHPGREIRVEPQVDVSAPSVYGDEVLLRQLLAHWITYVCAYVKSPATVMLKVEQVGKESLFTLRTSGEPAQEMMKGELAITGYICRALVELHGGSIRTGQSDETETVIQFSIPAGC